MEAEIETPVEVTPGLLGFLATETAETHPEVSTATLPEEPKPEILPTGAPVTPSGKPAKVPTDLQGRTFDPALHKKDRKGNPVLSSRGKLKLSPEGRKLSGQNKSVIGGADPSAALPGGTTENANGENPPKVEGAAVTAVPVGPDKGQRMMARLLVGAFTAVRVGIGGEKAAPDDEEEEDLQETFVDLFVSEGWHFSPRVAAGVATAAYIGGGLTTEEGRANVAKARDVILSKLGFKGA